MHSNGMKEAGYEYINVDGGWWEGSDTGHIERNSSGFPVIAAIDAEQLLWLTSIM